MPKQFEKKEIKGKLCMYVGTEWYPVKETTKEPTSEKSKNDIRGVLKIGEQELEFTARPTHYKNSGRNGYYIWLDRGQPFFGNGNVYLA